MRAKHTQEEIDNLVITQANDDSKWGKPTRVHRKRSTTLAIPAELAARAAFLARLHNQASIEEWITHIVRERVELEEAAFAGAKREIKEKNGA